MSLPIAPITLEGAYLRLEPLATTHAPRLFEIGNEPSIWTYLPSAPFKTPPDALRWIEDALRAAEQRTQLPFAAVDGASGMIAGSTRYLDLNPNERSIEIGWTWYGTSYQRTPLNTEAKFLLLEHAFERLGAVRVQFKTDLRNERSQRAIERLGARREGVLRKHMTLPKNGFIRDTVFYSVIDEEWPDVKARLRSLLTTAR